MRSAALYRVLAALLVLIAIALAWNHFGDLNPVRLDPFPQTAASKSCTPTRASCSPWRPDRSSAPSSEVFSSVPSPEGVLITLLVALLLASSVKVWRHY
jgi:hypothetical protein